MPKFILLYNGPATAMEDMSKEQSNEIMQKWQGWIDRNGDGIIDIGSPMANGVAVIDDGSTGTPTPLSGYTLIEAIDLDAAKALTEGHPFLSDGTGEFSIEIHQLYPIQM